MKNRKELLADARAEVAKIDSDEAVAIFKALRKIGFDILVAGADRKLTLAEAAQIAGDLRELADVIDEARER